VAHYHLRNIGEAKRFLSKCVDACQRDRAAQVYLERCNRFEETGVHEGTGEVNLHLQWNTSLAIGNPMIDNQHKSLFRCAAEFVETMKRSDSVSETSTAIRSLNQAVTEHFRDEEAFMEQAGYPFLYQQKQQHARFLRYFTELKRDIERDLNHKRLFLLFRMQVLIVDWLINHTGGMDRHFGKHLAGRTHG
jgi:hemerythrin